MEATLELMLPLYNLMFLNYLCVALVPLSSYQMQRHEILGWLVIIRRALTTRHFNLCVVRRLYLTLCTHGCIFIMTKSLNLIISFVELTHNNQNYLLEWFSFSSSPRRWLYMDLLSASSSLLVLANPEQSRKLVFGMALLFSGWWC